MYDKERTVYRAKVSSLLYFWGGQLYVLTAKARVQMLTNKVMVQLSKWFPMWNTVIKNNS